MTVRPRHFGIDNVLKLAEHLGKPQNNVRSYIHVSGINGKTSAVLFLARLLRVCVGLNVGTFTHPMMATPRDCIRINEESLEEERYSLLRKRVQETDGIFGTHCTLYEVEWMTALLAFKESSCDVIIVESALGGTDDATCILGRGGEEHHAKLLAAVITQVAFEHTHYLGTDLYDISKNLLGIYRPGALIIAGKMQPREFYETLHRNSLVLSKDVEVLGHFEAGDFMLTMPVEIHADNIDLALRTFQALEGEYPKRSRPEPSIFADMRFSTTLETFYYRNRIVYVDSAQNADSSLFKWLRTLTVPENAMIHLVLGVGDKDPQVLSNLIKALGSHAQCRVSFVKFQSPEGYPWIKPADREVIKNLLMECKCPFLLTEHTELQEVMFDMTGDTHLIIFGSPYIVHEFNRLYLIQ